ncbi:MAG TPA: hypothetical protein VLB76_25715 [Thermoanaerobaculia bacterium]|nr:hypothetical protein [Thermoanaerobaculia bacterium]
MPAIMEQTTNNAVTAEIVSLTFPGLAYSKESNQIAVSVIVSSSSKDPLGLSCRVPPIAIVGPGPLDPLPTWTVSWNFVLDGIVTTDNFSIRMPLILPASSPVTLESGSPNQFLIRFLTHDVKLTSFNYDIVVTGSNLKPHSEDPTIVVTPDPIT